MNFNNTKIAFYHYTDKELRLTYQLFKLISKPWMVSLGKVVVNFSVAIGLPIKWIVKPTIFNHFCGGENIDESLNTVEELDRFHVESILDYSVEGVSKEKSFDNTLDIILKTIRSAAIDERIPFSVFKFSGIGNVKEMVDFSDFEMTTEQQKIAKRVDIICQKAHKKNVPVLIDAEESWIQDFIDTVTEEMIFQYNKKEAIIFQTIQLYRKDKLAYLKELIKKCREHNVFLGVKLVRGAYMEKERERAKEKGYPSPIQPDKNHSDNAFNEAWQLCLENIDIVSVMAGTHNEESSLQLAKAMQKLSIPNDDPRIWFVQLYGMSDHISFNLAHHNYNVAKYLPFGPVKKVLPYLIRRAEENTSVKGQSGRELTLIKKELERRKKNNNNRTLKTTFIPTKTHQKT